MAMDNVVDELIRIAQKCDRAFAPFKAGPVKEMTGRLLTACNEMALSWSGSCIGYHATIYLKGFRKAGRLDIFDRQWGLVNVHFNQTRGDWIATDYDTVKDAIMSRAGVSGLEPIEDAAMRASITFDEARDELLPMLDAVLSDHDDKALREQREKLAKLARQIGMEDVARGELPRQVMSSDTRAMSEGVRAPHHTVFKAWMLEQFSYGSQAGEIAKIARYTARYVEQRLKMKGKSVAKTEGKIFIGHGGSADWKDLKDFIRDRLRLDYDEFNREPVAGLTAKERLVAMLDNACFAFLVMTAEDEHADGTRHARENVIHEIGLFQGRLSFERAIVLIEEGCEAFSNIAGVQQIRFEKGKLTAKLDELRSVLEREGIVK
jgi:predicted nucleotide-binding protein